jgi:hypothetical protein
MAQTKSLVTKGLRGSIGGSLVFRKINGQTIVSASPEMVPQEPSIKQKEQREKFRQASLYAQRVDSDPELRAEYVLGAKLKGFPNVRSFIIADFFRSPEILSIRVSTEPAGSILETIVVDFMRVKTVTVVVNDPVGSMLETGNAVMGIDKQTWTYNFTNPANLAAGAIFEITATDLSGNTSTKSFDYQIR